MILTLVLVALVGVNAANGLCDRSQYTKFGCFKRNVAIFPDLLATNRDKSSDVYIGESINWNNFKSSLDKLTCTCLKKVQEGGYEAFALGYYGECWGSKNKDAVTKLLSYGKSATSNKCIGHHYGTCENMNDKNHCIGDANSVYVYSLPAKAPEPIDGGYSEWSEFSSCSKTCDEGLKFRERQCIEPAPKNGGKDCTYLGSTSDSESCKLRECPVDGKLSQWSDWNACNKKCGGGSQSRSRTCTPPKYGGVPCSGSLTESQQCNTQNCPVDGKLSQWSDWNACDKQCGGGTQSRSRTCTPPKYGGAACSGSLTQSQQCNTNNCPVDGKLSQWSDWNACNKKCGGGSQSRSRTCTPPKYGGAPCSGSLTETQQCNTQNCPVDGKLSQWSDWDACDKQCGGGSQSRSRTCTPPKYGGAACSGSLTQSQQCNTQNCPVDGKLSQWSNWNACNKQCGGGSQSRSRTCTPPEYGGSPCSGSLTQSQQCNTRNCPVNGKLSSWSKWNTCNKRCGGGSQSRSRTCTPPKYGGAPCSGSLIQSQQCNTQNCPVPGKLSHWSNWNACNKQCGGGSQSRSRTCTPPKYGGSPCSGSLTESRKCSTQNCPVNGKWLSWSGWSGCSRTCGGGSSYRTRTCQGPYYGGKACSGSNKETRRCGTETCLVKSDFEQRIKNIMSSHQSQSHSSFANTLKNSLSSTYPSYYFTVSAYNKCSGFDNHAVTGYSYQHVWRQYGRNIVVTYVKKTSRFPSSSKRNEIKNAVVNAINKKGRSAKTSMDLAWNKAKSFGYPIASVHVVRFGNGLRSVASGYWNFENFVCDRSCNWLKQCTNHQSSVVITYGSA